MNETLLNRIKDRISLPDAGKAPLVKLKDGVEMPQLGLGTWLGWNKTGPIKSSGDEVVKAVEAAIDAGYRHIDTASIYHTEDQIGKAIKNKISENKIKREDLFITTKLWNTNHAKDAVMPALRESLKQLDLKYVDLYLIHFPVAHDNNFHLQQIDFVDTWRGMIEAQSLGLTRSIGVSNFNHEQIDRLIAETNHTPSVLQIEVNLNIQQPILLTYCKEKQIVVTAYTPFGSLFYSKAAKDAPPPRVDDPVLVELAHKYNKTTTQINLRYLIELGTVPIPKSINKNRIEENIDVFDFVLSTEDKLKLKSFDRHYRTLQITTWSHAPDYPFNKD